MGRRRLTRTFANLRGRWKDNEGLVDRIISIAKEHGDWSHAADKVVAVGAETLVPKPRLYARLPDLRHISFDKRDIAGCRLASSCLAGATAFKAMAAEIDCQNAILSGSRWSKASAPKGNFSRIRGSRVNFSRCDLRGANFSQAYLHGANFTGANLEGCTFAKADLMFANLSEAHCDGADFSGAKLFGLSAWGIEYKRLKSDELDLSRDGDGTITTNQLRLAPLVALLARERALSEVVYLLKLNAVVVLGRDSTADSYGVSIRLRTPSIHLKS